MYLNVKHQLAVEAKQKTPILHEDIGPNTKKLWLINQSTVLINTPQRSSVANANSLNKNHSRQILRLKEACAFIKKNLYLFFILYLFFCKDITLSFKDPKKGSL